MTKKEIEAFLQEIGSVCARHRIGCFVGLWFGSKGHNEMGISANHDVTDTEMRLLSECLKEFLTHHLGSVPTAKKLGSYRGTTTGQDGEHN